MFEYFKERLEKFQSGKRAVYDDQYYQEEYFRHLNAPYGFVVKPYHRYIAYFGMANPTQIKKGANVLEIGCGIGTLTGEFKKLGYNIVGVDVNEAAIRNSVSPENCVLVKNPAKLDYPDRYFDLIVSKETFEHIPESEIDALIKELDRVGKGKMVHIVAVEERGAVSTKNPAHINIKPNKWWVDKFKQYGYSVKKPPKWLFYLLGHKGYFILTK
jgi:ubiquinone/menaquinone biosynthesis C-methylase UbiE